MSRGLTNRQRQVLEYIYGQIRGMECPPTFRQIAQEFSIRSTNGVNSIVDALSRKGYLDKRSRESRGFRLTAKALGLLDGIPLVGRVAAGTPILAEENIEGRVATDPFRHLPRDSFALTVRGESMKDAGIMDGDIVFVRAQQTADRGDIVVARIGEEATVKRYYPEQHHVRLEPANAAFEPIIVDAGSPGFQIEGKVVGLMRQY